MLIKVLDDYGRWPLWVRDRPGEMSDSRDPATLGLTPSLVERFAAWQQWYEPMVNIADPNDSRPVTAVEPARVLRLVVHHHGEGAGSAVRIGPCELDGARLHEVELCAGHAR